MTYNLIKINIFSCDSLQLCKLSSQSELLPRERLCYIRKALPVQEGCVDG